MCFISPPSSAWSFVMRKTFAQKLPITEYSTKIIRHFFYTLHYVNSIYNFFQFNQNVLERDILDNRVDLVWLQMNVFL